MRRPRQTKHLPQIRKQKGSDCASYADAGLTEYVYSAKKDIKLDLDPQSFYKALKRKYGNKGATNLRHVLDEMKTKGMYDNKLKRRIKIKGWGRVEGGVKAWNKVRSGVPCILSLDLESGETFRQRTPDGGVVKPRYKGFHAVVALEVNGIYMVCANSWGENYGKNGYFFIPRYLRTKLIQSGYSITI